MAWAILHGMQRCALFRLTITASVSDQWIWFGQTPGEDSSGSYHATKYSGPVWHPLGILTVRSCVFVNLYWFGSTTSNRGSVNQSVIGWNRRLIRISNQHMSSWFKRHMCYKYCLREMKETASKTKHALLQIKRRHVFLIARDILTRDDFLYVSIKINLVRRHRWFTGLSWFTTSIFDSAILCVSL